MPITTGNMPKGLAGGMGSVKALVKAAKSKSPRVRKAAGAAKSFAHDLCKHAHHPPRKG